MVDIFIFINGLLSSVAAPRRVRMRDAMPGPDKASRCQASYMVIVAQQVSVLQIRD